ncbi:hypothetical protein [Kingella bonacorsii]|nr:hypothetical protein [Kingella bonacorsii]
MGFVELGFQAASVFSGCLSCFRLKPLQNLQLMERRRLADILVNQ